MTKSDLLEFLKSYIYAVQSSVTASESPQSSVVGIAVDDNFQIIFDSIESTRKIRNLRINPSISLVIGGTNEGDERTVQYEGIADEPSGDELDETKITYFKKFPDGRDRQSWEGITYVRVKPKWIRYSDYNKGPPEIIEFDF